MIQKHIREAPLMVLPGHSSTWDKSRQIGSGLALLAEQVSVKDPTVADTVKEAFGRLFGAKQPKVAYREQFVDWCQAAHSTKLGAYFDNPEAGDSSLYMMLRFYKKGRKPYACFELTISSSGDVIKVATSKF